MPDQVTTPRRRILSRLATILRHPVAFVAMITLNAVSLLRSLSLAEPGSTEARILGATLVVLAVFAAGGAMVWLTTPASAHGPGYRHRPPGLTHISRLEYARIVAAKRLCLLAAHVHPAAVVSLALEIERKYQVERVLASISSPAEATPPMPARASMTPSAARHQSFVARALDTMLFCGLSGLLLLYVVALAAHLAMGGRVQLHNAAALISLLWPWVMMLDAGHPDFSDQHHPADAGHTTA